MAMKLQFNDDDLRIIAECILDSRDAGLDSAPADTDDTTIRYTEAGEKFEVTLDGEKLTGTIALDQFIAVMEELEIGYVAGTFEAAEAVEINDNRYAEEIPRSLAGRGVYIHDAWIQTQEWYPAWSANFDSCFN